MLIFASARNSELQNSAFDPQICTKSLDKFSLNHNPVSDCVTPLQFSLSLAAHFLLVTCMCRSFHAFVYPCIHRFSYRAVHKSITLNLFSAPLLTDLRRIVLLSEELSAEAEMTIKNIFIAQELLTSCMCLCLCVYACVYRYVGTSQKHCQYQPN